VRKMKKLLLENFIKSFKESLEKENIEEIKGLIALMEVELSPENFLERGYICIDMTELNIINNNGFSLGGLIEIEKGLKDQGTEWVEEKIKEANVYKKSEEWYVVRPVYVSDYDCDIDLSYWDIEIDDYCIRKNKEIQEYNETLLL